MDDPRPHNLKIADVALELNCSAASVRKWITQGSFPHAFKVGASWRIPASDVDAFKQPHAAPGPVPWAGAAPPQMASAGPGMPSPAELAALAAQMAGDEQPPRLDPGHAALALDPAHARRMRLAQVIEFIPVEAYHTVADVQCGQGLFTAVLASIAEQGTVYAIESDAALLERARQHVAEVGLSNVEYLQPERGALPLGDAAVHGAFMALAFHEVADRPAFIRELWRIIKPGGWLTMIEWVREPTGEGPPLEQRLTAEDLLVLAEDGGFKLIDHVEINDAHYLVSYRR